MRRAFLLAALPLLAACTPQPRSESYFEAHPAETARVSNACVSGERRGAECNAARAAEARFKANARLQAYRKGF